MKRRLFTQIGKRIAAGALAMMFAVTGPGCATTGTVAPDPTSPTVAPQPAPKDPVVEELTDEQRTEMRKALVDMAFKLMSESTTNKTADNANAMMSPLSVAIALSMTANGAKENTLAQMLTLLGGEGADLNVLNAFMHEYAFNLPSSDNTKARIANSIWYRDNEKLAVTDYFKDANHKFYNAVMKPVQFDQQTVNDINQWCSDNTDKMIEKIVDELDPDTMLCILNAIVFDGTWETEYEDFQVTKESFTNAKGEQKNVTMLNSTEKRYLENDFLTGVIKSYKDGYEFIGLLPKDGVTTDELIAKLDGDSYFDLFENVEHTDVYTKIPEFETEDDYDLVDILAKMGMTDAFRADAADFSNMATTADGYPLYISDVIHKTYIKLDRYGTKAAAVTAVIVCEATAMPTEEPKFVYLDRPFVYVIADSETHTPLFIGVTNNIE